MVSKKAHQRKAIKKKSQVVRKLPAKQRRVRRRTLRDRFGGWWWAFLFGLLVLVAMFTVVELHRGDKSGEIGTIEESQQEESGELAEGTAEETEAEKTAEEAATVEAIDLQPVVDKWVASVGGTKSVLIYDLERDEVVGQYDSAKNYNTASLYKLFVVYEGYRRVQSGEWDVKTKVGATGKTIAKCLDLAIRESNSPCAEGLWAMIGHDTLDKIIEQDFKITKSDISALSSNADDIRKIMQIFYEHTEITDEDLVATMQDSFLNQPIVDGYEWRQGLPSGFSENVKVYDKVGWAYNTDKKWWDIYHDAAIVEFPEIDRHFIVVVLTKYIDYQKIAKLGTAIENAVLGN